MIELAMRELPLRSRIICLIGLWVSLLIGAAPATAWACKIKPAPDPLPSGASPWVGAEVPSLTLLGVSLTRAKHAPPGDGDCAEIGHLGLSFRATNLSEWPDNLGIMLSLEKGAFPPAFPIPSYPMVASQGTLLFAGPDDPAQSIDFTLQAVAVDSSGNASSPIAVHVSDPGRQSGCAFFGRPSAGRAGSFVLFLGLCLVASRALRRRSSRATP
jgi:hypothetical protein